MTQELMFQPIAERLQLERALSEVGRANDLLPRRPEDDIAGSIGRRLSEPLRQALRDGSYKPSPAYFVSVPKRAHTTRPAALLALEDRTLFEAIVQLLRDRIEERLVSPEFVMWPRGVECLRRWSDFESAPIREAASFVVAADIAGFYESIDHQLLRDTLLRITGRAELVTPLMYFLNIVMGRSRGLPQGLRPSDQLATAYLVPVDEAMVQRGFRYVRNGDDLRVSASSYDEARAAMSTLESAVRERGLLLNSAKSRLMSIREYDLELNDVREERRRHDQKLTELRAQSLRVDESELATVLESLGLKDVGMSIWYHANMSVDEAVESIREHLRPTDVDVAKALFDDSYDRRVHSGSERKLSASQFHSRITDALRTLRAARSPHALNRCGQLLLEHPDETSLIAGYLMSLPDAHSTAVTETATRVLMLPQFRTPLQFSWLFRLVARDPSKVSPEVVSILREHALDDSQNWASRAEAAVALARSNALDEPSFLRLWGTAPRVFHPQLVAAVGAAANPSPDWAKRFLSGVAHSPLLHAAARR